MRYSKAKNPKISKENVFKLVHLTEIQRNKLNNWIIYNILQIDLTNHGSFLATWMLGCNVISIAELGSKKQFGLAESF